MKNTQKQSGSAHVVIIMILIAALLGALAYIFVQNLNTSPNSSTSTAGDSTAKSNNDTNTPAQSATDRLQDFYAKYLADVSGLNGAGTPDDQIAKYKAEGYISSDFSSVGGDGEPVTCGGTEGYPDSVTVVIKKNGAKTANLNVTKVYNDTGSGTDGQGGKSMYTIEVSMTVASSNVWQVSAITCSKS
jgi:hypothetical protein